MNTKRLTCLLVLSLLLVHYVATFETASFCDTTVGPLVDNADPKYTHDKDQYVKLTSMQLLYDIKTSLQSDGHNAYHYYLQKKAAADAFFDLRIIKIGPNGQPKYSDTITTAIVGTQTIDKDTIGDFFLGAESRFVALRQLGTTGSTIQFYWITDGSVIAAAETFTFGTETFYKISAGNNVGSASFFTKTALNRTKLYSLVGAQNGAITNADAVLTSSTAFTSSEQFLFASSSGFLWIDGSALNKGVQALVFVATAGTAQIVAITTGATAPVISTATGIHLNYDVNVLDFSDSYFVAMHDENYANSVLFFVDASDATPSYVDDLSLSVTVPDNTQVNSYYSDQNSNYLLVRTVIASGIVSQAILTFVDSYDSATQRIFRYGALIINGAPSAGLLTDLFTTGTDAFKVSFSYISSSQYYNLFILKVEPTTTTIIRYFYDTSAHTDAGYQSIVANQLQEHYSLTLNTKTNDLFRQKLDDDEVQVMTFEYACTCAVTQISQFVCFGASLECTVAVQNYNTDCTVEATTTQTDQWAVYA